jgi:hypothetical protein
MTLAGYAGADPIPQTGHASLTMWPIAANVLSWLTNVLAHKNETPIKVIGYLAVYS